MTTKWTPTSDSQKLETNDFEPIWQFVDIFYLIRFSTITFTGHEKTLLLDEYYHKFLKLKTKRDLKKQMTLEHVSQIALRLKQIIYFYFQPNYLTDIFFTIDKMLAKQVKFGSYRPENIKRLIKLYKDNLLLVQLHRLDYIFFPLGILIAISNKQTYLMALKAILIRLKRSFMALPQQLIERINDQIAAFEIGHVWGDKEIKFATDLVYALITERYGFGDFNLTNKRYDEPSYQYRDKHLKVIEKLIKIMNQPDQSDFYHQQAERYETLIYRLNRQLGWFWSQMIFENRQFYHFVRQPLIEHRQSPLAKKSASKAKPVKPTNKSKPEKLSKAQAKPTNAKSKS